MGYTNDRKNLRILEEYIVKDSMITIMKIISKPCFGSGNKVLNLHFVLIYSIHAILLLIGKFTFKNKFVFHLLLGFF